jgi:uncharacterized phage-associated protein
MVNKLQFDLKKAIEVLLFITKRQNDTYKALKIAYFADILHLGRYGRLIFGDRYIAMEAGPVPSNLYDIVKFIRKDGIYRLDQTILELFTISGYDIFPARDPNLDYLSESDVECLSETIQKYGTKSFSELKNLSHDNAYNSANPNGEISLDGLINSLPNSVQLKEYLYD